MPGIDEFEGESGLPPGHSIEVYETENPIVAVLLGPDGEVLIEMRERPVQPFGFSSQ